MNIKKDELKNFFRNVVGIGIGVVILLIFRAIVLSLSGMNTPIASNFYITVGSIVSLVILAFIVVLIYRFNKQCKPIIEKAVPSFSEATKLFEYIMFIIIIFVSYSALRGIIVPLLSRINLAWLYQFIFVCIAAYPVYVISKIAVDSSDYIVNFIFKENRVGNKEVAAEEVSETELVSEEQSENKKKDNQDETIREE
ncbi:hypothetical protein [Natronospora cellulosivora (SeqCode)]